MSLFLFFFSTSQAKNLDKFNKANNISDYFSGILLLNQSKYNESYKYLKRLDGLEINHLTFSSKYLYSLINSGNLYPAFQYSKKLEREKLDNFESDLIIGIYYLKNTRFDLAAKYFLKAKKRNSRTILDNYLVSSLYLWSISNKNNLEETILNLNELDNRFENLKKIQNVFFNCYFNSDKTERLFKDLISNQKTDFSRYNFFYANYLNSAGDKERAKKIIKDSLTKYPRNLLINQYNLDLKNSHKNFEFNCKEEQHVVAELLYITANALSTQSIYPLSNFYLNLSKYLNKQFYAYDTLMAENFYKINDFTKSKKIYVKLSKIGDAFKWYSNKQIARILIKEEKKTRH